MLQENQDLISWRQTQRVMGARVVIGLVDTELGVISIPMETNIKNVMRYSVEGCVQI